MHKLHIQLFQQRLSKNSVKTYVTMLKSSLRLPFGIVAYVFTFFFFFFFFGPLSKQLHLSLQQNRTYLFCHFFSVFTLQTKSERSLEGLANYIQIINFNAMSQYSTLRFSCSLSAAINRGYYTTEQKYKFISSSHAALCNFLFITLTNPSLTIFLLTVCTNNCEKAGNDVVNILTSENMENMPLRFQM